MDKFKWIVAQPLIGGFAFGAYEEFGLPEAIVTGFAQNDNQYINYMNEQKKFNVPVIKMTPDYKEKIEGIDIEKEVDAWIMVPICSGLSTANTSKKVETKPGNADNKQNQNMYNILDLAMRNKPRAIAFENAPAFAQPMGKEVRKRINEIAKKYGYSFQVMFTSTFMHGIPQDRKRSFAIFFRDGKRRYFEYENVEKMTIENYLKFKVPENAKYQDIEISTSYKNDKYVNAVMKAFNLNTFSELCEWVKEKYPMKMISILNVIQFEGTDKFEKWLAGDPTFERMKHKRYFDTSWLFCTRGYTGSLIYKSLHMFHPDYSKGRSLTLREAMTMMGLPLDFEYSDGFNPNMICQNVPVCTGNYIVRNIKSALVDCLEIVEDNDKILIQNNLKRSHIFEEVN